MTRCSSTAGDMRSRHALDVRESTTHATSLRETVQSLRAVGGTRRDRARLLLAAQVAPHHRTHSTIERSIRGYAIVHRMDGRRLGVELRRARSA